MKRFLISSRIIQEVLLNRSGFVEDADRLWELMQKKEIQGYITQRGLDIIHLLVIDFVGEDKSEKIVSDIKQVVEVCPTESIIQQARSYRLVDFESAVELACAINTNVDAILTQNIQDFSGTDFPILLLSEFLRQEVDKDVRNKLDHIFFQDDSRYLYLFHRINTNDHQWIFPSDPQLSQVFQFIESNYDQSISLCDVAVAVGHCPAYLTDLVRRQTGKTVNDWIVERRMVAARTLLLETNHCVSQIAQSTGYQHEGHFFRQFRQHHGTTPQTWRKMQRNRD